MKRWWVLTFFLIFIAGWVYYHRFEVENWARVGSPVQVEPSLIGERTLIIAPHPDDETLGGAGMIQKALAQKKSVKVVIVTTGDGYTGAVRSNFGVDQPVAADFRRLGMVRHQEALKAVVHLGVKPQDVVFLGYPDGGINGMWGRDWDYDHLHKGLNGKDHSPYDFSYEKNAAYCGENLVKNLSEIIQMYKPTDIIYPDPHDRHHDHWATSAFVKYVLVKDQFKGKEWTFLIHRGTFPYPRSYKPELPMHPPTTLEGMDTKWHYFSMTDKEKQLKYEAILKHETQTRVMKSFLLSFVRTNDMLGTYTDPVIPVLGKEENLMNTLKLHPLMFPDPEADTVTRENMPDADLLRVGVLETTQNLLVGFETKASIHEKVDYNIHLRFLSPQGVNRVDTVVNKRWVTSRKYAKNSIMLNKQTRIYIENNRLWMTLPKDLLADRQGLMVSVDTSLVKKTIDRTAWRYARIENREKPH